MLSRVKKASSHLGQYRFKIREGSPEGNPLYECTAR